MRVPGYQEPVEILIENTINPYVMACLAKLDLLCQISQKMILTILLIPNNYAHNSIQGREEDYFTGNSSSHYRQYSESEGDSGMSPAWWQKSKILCNWMSLFQVRIESHLSTVRYTNCICVCLILQSIQNHWTQFPSYIIFYSTFCFWHNTVWLLLSWITIGRFQKTSINADEIRLLLEIC